MIRISLSSSYVSLKASNFAVHSFSTENDSWIWTGCSVCQPLSVLFWERFYGKIFLLTLRAFNAMQARHALPDFPGHFRDLSWYNPCCFKNSKHSASYESTLRTNISICIDMVSPIPPPTPLFIYVIVLRLRKIAFTRAKYVVCVSQSDMGEHTPEQ